MATGGVPELGGYDYEFVDEILDDWECLVCQLPLKDPVQIQGCGHRLCEICIETILKSDRPQCPADREPISRDRVFSDVACRRKILSARVKCSNKGCSWSGELRAVKKHEEDCPYLPVHCVNTGCDKAVLRKDVVAHVESTCLWTIMQCIYCSAQFPRIEKQAHNDACGKYPVECSNKCGVKNIPREKLRHHIDTSCPLSVIDCEFHAIGCAIKIQRHDIQAHFDAYKDTHLHLACKCLVEMSKTIQEQSQQIYHLEAKLQRCETAPFIWKIPNFGSVMESARTEERTVISSGPFYSASNGYKFEMELYPNGYYTEHAVQARGKFMSIYIRVLVGEYDGVLTWPFTDSVMFTLLDQNESYVKKRNLNRKLVIAPGLSRPTDNVQQACGLWQFISHQELFSVPSYIKDDVVYIKVFFLGHKSRKSVSERDLSGLL